MSEVKHTAGPWKVLPEEVAVGYIRVRGTRPGGLYKIANVICESPFSAKEARANAKLIEATPDLLEALVRIGREASKCSDSVNTDSIYIWATDAIAEAKGESA